MTTKTAGTYTLKFLVASSLGAALGILFAPKAGVETRADLAQQMRRLALKFRRNRAEIQASVQEIFGNLSDELEQAYLQVRGEVMAQIDVLDQAEDMQTVYRNVIKSAVTAASKGQKWTKAQIDKFIAHLEREYQSEHGIETS